ncbi:Porin [Rhodovastum atsumiense]|uniref:Porin n=1 Tax=Rhodovastum atsumiense TaxID=504468 RepID=A0A5M6IJX7_9PROT|nr:outer membrane beta-barrel protein [Rhodovastum atsumiense]KAA5607878.1 porin [Rhodovastum atsumiense]CAH2604241.1 Porin [Rhodovastum atsumiense]
MTRFRLAASTALVAAALAAGAPARAEDAPTSWQDSIKFGAQIQSGITFNPAGPKTNFGQALTDHPNQLMLNQALLTVSREIPKDASGWDVGFKVQGLYGSDARYTHYIGVLNQAITDRNQLDLVEANVTAHMPVLTAGGIDLKLGLFSTPIGFETIDPSTNAFYSHSYIFSYALPFKHTGGLANIHVTDFLDIYGGLTTGVNTTFPTGGDNNSSMSGIVGFGLNLLDGKLTAVVLSHIGPENASYTPTQSVGVPNANHYNRYYNDAYVTYKHNDKLSFTTEINYTKDDLIGAEAFGVAQYVSYAITDTVTLNARGEIFRDGKGFYVGYFPGNLDFINFERGRPSTSVGGPHATYGALTFGATWKPDLPKPISGLLVRPEVRYDAGLAGPKPYNNGKDNGQFTIATDVVLTF